MTSKGLVYYNEIEAGVLEKQDGEYVFQYLPAYLSRPGARPVSITLPMQAEEYRSKQLFPFFANLLSEGVNKRLQCLRWKIDERDYFSLLLKTTQKETIGAVTIKPIEE
ncbi:HipA N-terminal domain-containing protein [Flavihumibacter stibioxidans]|uniref:Phosphatidylinositol kinase n=1 Tax=Flavihumibacter stibioxidans TaxID=1834163 RepID=A0ABR7M7S3_9BACT|nr:HipA N-terminal domain-containing protein [Flavihumibacter stibioxidans]MBC6490997.1 phosphatidylinositol kinase [Flavihumibacter stibioxidans]